MSSHELLWKPSSEQQSATQIEAFRRTVNQTYGLNLQNYGDLHAWSVSEPELFWNMVWDDAGLIAERRGDTVLERPDALPGARWYPEARLNYAENLLRQRDDTPALMFKCEQGDIVSISGAELYRQVAAVAHQLRQLGVQPGERIAGFMPNIPQTMIAMLAAASVGAVWSSCSPDFGINGVRDRFGQIEPRVLFTADGYFYAGKTHDSLSVISELAESLPSLKAIVVVPFVHSQAELSGSGTALQTRWNDWVETPEAQAGHTLVFEQLPFDHPLFIMFSSGTTGKPKCIVHSAGGTLLQHVKEHRLHADVRPGDRLFFFTTCGWMMWNWLASGLACEATLLLYDGSPFYPDGNVLFDYADQVGMTQFGTSAKFIDACNKEGLSPVKTHQLDRLRAVLSTGSPLVPESFDYVYSQISGDVCLSSMSGGTDILSCFVLGNPAGSVYRGELQCKGLGMDVRVYSEGGESLAPGEKGELVCVNAFPSMPVGFFNDDSGERYHNAYFARFDNVWCHGDFIAETDHGGIVIFGRSDAVLNPGGVRIGTAEIYRQVESFDEVVESLVIGQQWQGDVRVVLFVRLRDGVVLDDALQTRIARHIREQTTPRHVPARIVAVADIPRTRSGKIVELAVRKVVHGESIDNVEALANPEALKLFADLPELQA